MARYGTARTYAQRSPKRGVARLLAQTLKEEKAADLTLTRIAERSVNEDAAEEWQGQVETAVAWSDGRMGWIDGRVRVPTTSEGVRTAASAVGVTNDGPSRRAPHLAAAQTELPAAERRHEDR